VYTIGEISKIVRISANALRYYDEIGLFKPIVTKSDNQYRYYSDAQVKDILLIMELKQYGFTLIEIKELIQNRTNQKFRQMLEQKRIELNNKMLEIKCSSILLEKRIFEIINEEELNVKSKKILIVDDLELVRIMIKNIIEEYGYTSIGEASNGQEAVEIYEKLKPDIVIMDITMPIMDGIDAAMKITSKYKDARIIMCSSTSNLRVITDSFKAGARDFISKPLSNFRLMKAVVSVLSDQCALDKDRIESFLSAVAKHGNDKLFDINLNQEEIDAFIDIDLQDNEDKYIDTYLKKINCRYIDNNESIVAESLPLEEKVMIELKSKFTDISEQLSVYMSRECGQDCMLTLLTVESITLSEFKTLIDDNSSIGSIEYKTIDSPIYVNVYGEFKNKITVLREVLSFVENNLQLTNTNNDNEYISISLDDSKMLDEDYSTVLISYKIEIEPGNKGFIAINIPYSYKDISLIKVFI